MHWSFCFYSLLSTLVFIIFDHLHLCSLAFFPSLWCLSLDYLFIIFLIFFNVNTYKIYLEFLIILLWLSFDSKKYRSSFLASSVSHRSLSSALLTLQIFRSFLLGPIFTLFCYNLIIYMKLHQLFHILCWLYVL